MNFVKSLPVLLALSLAGAAAAQEGTPVFVQPPQTQTAPAQTPAPVLASATAVLPATDGVTLWGGFASEVLIIPLLNLNVSVPVVRGPGYGVAARLTGETLSTAANALGADVLLGRPDGRGVYGGPGAALVFGENLRGWRAGVSTGYRDTFGQGRLGYYAEAKLNYLAWRGGGCAELTSPYGNGEPCNDNFWLVSPGLRFGLTYRF